MKTRKQKVDDLKDLKDRIKKSKLTVITSFARQGEKGMKDSEMREMKKALSSLEAKYFVEKKTLLDKALSEAKQEMDVYKVGGSLGVTYAFGDEFAMAKSLSVFAKKFPALKLFGGIYNGKAVTEAEVMEMAKMPTREVLLGRLVGMLSYPIRGLAVVLNEISKTLIPKS